MQHPSRLTHLARAAALAAIVLSASQAHAVELIAVGTVQSPVDAFNHQIDYSGLNYLLEDNVNTGNAFGGMGSGLAWAGGNTFLAVPDRGPNATTYNPLVDNTTSYISRFQTITMNLTATPSGNLPYTLTPTLTATTLLSSTSALNYGTGALGTGSSGGVNYTLGSGVPALNASSGLNYFTGRSDGFSSTGSTNPNNARLDPEAIRVSNDGTKVYVSDEYGPYVYEFDRATGVRTKTFTLPAALAVNTLGPTTASEGSPTNTTGRVANKGMEGLAITPDGKTLVGVMQAPLLQDTKKNIRIVTIDIATGATHQYAYTLSTGSGVSEIVALNNHQFLLDERDGNGLADKPLLTDTASSAVNKSLYKIDLNGATELTATDKGDLTSKAVVKTQVVDLVAVLTAAGIPANMIPSKLEGFAFGEDVVINGVTKHTIYFANDNDFLAEVADPNKAAGDPTRGMVANPNKVYVIAATDAELGATFTPQAITAVPEPQTWAMLAGGLSLLMWTARNQRKRD